MENETVKIPECLKEFEIDGKSFKLDLTEASKQIKAIASESTSNYEHLDAFGKYIETRGGPSLSNGQLEWLWRWVVTNQTETSRHFFDSLKSLSSTG